MKMINRMLSILSNQKATPKKVLSTPKRKATSSTPKAKKRFFERSDITTSFSTPSEMCSKFGFEAVVLLCFATQHVPIMFPNRLTYIRNIVNSGKRTFTSEEILDSVQSVESWKDTPWPLSGYSYHRTLWEISQHTSTSHMLFLAPPVDSCLHCGGKVYASDSSSHATVFTLGFGPLPALKCTLRCRECSSRYNLCDYRIPNIGTKYYPSNCVTPYVEVSTCTYFEKNVHEFMCESSNHGIVSASAFTEIYNSVYSTDHNFTRNFYESKLSASNSFKDPPAEDHTPVYLPNYEKEHSSSTADINCIEQELRSTGYQVTMSRKNAINSFFNGELEKEVRERQMVEEVTFQKKDDRKVLMNKIDELRRAELYPHTETECSSICKERGCENLRIIDGNWKLCVQHCLYSIPMEIDGQPLLNFPSVCTQEPQAGSVFCDDHFQLLKKKEIPVSKPDFLRCAGIDGPPKNPEERKEYDSKLAAFCRKLDGKDNISKSAAYYQGTEQLLKKLGPSAVNDVPEDLCNKDTGEKSHMRQRARGHVVVVSGGGNILYWNPVYKSESPSQVFVQIVNVLYMETAHMTPEEQEEAIKKYIISYDNICHLDKLKAAQQDLPLPSPLNKIWKLVTKIIDRLHIRNHKDKQCQQKYNPENVLTKKHNTMAAEQLFSWASRFKKIVNMMTQSHHMFYLHRMFQRRNKYTGHCRQKGIEPLLPNVFEKDSSN
ncbi:uncharacterized protein [Mytilus edulis]